MNSCLDNIYRSNHIQQTGLMETGLMHHPDRALGTLEPIVMKCA